MSWDTSVAAQVGLTSSGNRNSGTSYDDNLLLAAQNVKQTVKLALGGFVSVLKVNVFGGSGFLFRNLAPLGWRLTTATDLDFPNVCIDLRFQRRSTPRKRGG